MRVQEKHVKQLRHVSTENTSLQKLLEITATGNLTSAMICSTLRTPDPHNPLRTAKYQANTSNLRSVASRMFFDVTRSAHKKRSTQNTNKDTVQQ